MNRLFDKYFWFARVMPGIVVSLPLIVAVYLAVPDFASTLASISSKTTINIALLFLLSLIVRGFGRRVEIRLVQEWNGLPTARWIKWSDGTHSDQWKQKLHDNIHHLTSIKLLSRKEESLNPSEAEKRIQDAVGILRTKFRHSNSVGLVNTFNMEYGACRNLLGSRWLWVSVSAFTVLISALAWFMDFGSYAGWSLLTCVRLLAVALTVGILVLPQLTKNIAERYASEFLSVIINTDNNDVAKGSNNG